jgi:hypothetical protein
LLGNDDIQVIEVDDDDEIVEVIEVPGQSRRNLLINEIFSPANSNIHFKPLSNDTLIMINLPRKDTRDQLEIDKYKRRCNGVYMVTIYN